MPPGSQAGQAWCSSFPVRTYLHRPAATTPLPNRKAAPHPPSSPLHPCTSHPPLYIHYLPYTPPHACRTHSVPALQVGGAEPALYALCLGDTLVFDRMDGWDAVTVKRPVTSTGVSDVHGNQQLVTSLAQVEAAKKGAQAVSAGGERGCFRFSRCGKGYLGGAGVHGNQHLGTGVAQAEAAKKGVLAVSEVVGTNAAAGSQ